MKQKSIQNLEQEPVKQDESMPLLSNDEEMQNEVDTKGELAIQDEVLNNEQDDQASEPAEENSEHQEEIAKETPMPEIESFTEIENEEPDENKKKVFSWLTFVVIVLTLFQVILICFKMGNIGFNSFTAWDVDRVELTSENLQILNNTKLNIFGDAKDRKRLYSTKFKWNI